MLVIDINDVIAKTRVIAGANPDYIYQRTEGDLSTCTYVKHGMASCLFGRALSALGVLIEKIKVFDSGIMSMGISDVLETWDDELRFVNRTQENVYWCERVQTKQDAKSRWEDAVAYADNEAELDNLVYA